MGRRFPFFTIPSGGEFYSALSGVVRGWDYDFNVYGFEIELLCFDGVF